MKPISIRYLGGGDVAPLPLASHETLAAIEPSPRARLVPQARCGGCFRVLRGYVAPASAAGTGSRR